MTDAPPIVRALGWTRAIGRCADFAASTLAGFALGHLLGHGRLGTGLGAVAGGLSALRWTSRTAGRAIQRERPELGSSLEAYLEGKGGILRPHLERWLTARVRPAWRPLSWRWPAAAGLGAVLSLALAPSSAPLKSLPADSPLAATLSLTARVQPPPYTHWPEVEAELPHVRGLRSSVVHLEALSNAARLRWAEQGGAEHTLLPVEGRATLELPLDRSRSLRLGVDPDGPWVLVDLEAVADGPPQVTLESPETDRSVTRAPGPFELRASAQDDVGVSQLGFRWTLAQGQGEGMRFRSGALAPARALLGPAASALGRLDPLALGMKAGDTLVVWAEAADGNTATGPGVGRSAVRVLRWQEDVVDFSGAARSAPLATPPSQLTERELLARTERLVRAHPPAAARRTQSAELAEEQRHIRDAFGFFLQQENQKSAQLDVDDPEVAESGDASARASLARAVSEMWAAEAELAVGNPAGALGPERAAVAALEKAFGSERVALRALRPPDKPVDEALRLSGAQTGLRPRAVAASAVVPRRTQLEALARRLLLSAEQEVTADETRALADAVWALPADAGIAAGAVAAPLYAAVDGPARRAAARAAGIALARALGASPETVPPVSSEEAAVLARLPIPPLPP